MPPFLEDIERERERVQSFVDAQTAPKSRPGKVAIKKNTQMNEQQYQDADESQESDWGMGMSGQNTTEFAGYDHL